jgi:YegS/Rv2252/BmrU family lipid kinase
MTFRIIFNPAANRGRAQQSRAAIEAAFRSHDLPFEIVPTERKGHAQQLAAEAAASDRYRAVVAAGGDGTINEIVNGLLGSDKPLGFVPLGTGNDWVKLFDIRPNQPQHAVQRLHNGTMRQVDIGMINGRAFLNGGGCGFDAQVAIEAARAKHFGGLTVYLIALARALRRYRSPVMRVSWAGNVVQRRLLLAAASNGRCVGGGFWLAPEAQIDDGLLDLCLCDALRLDQLVRYVPKVLRGTHANLRQVHMARATAITIESSEPLPAYADGEVLGTALHEVEISVWPSALRILV